MEQEKKDLYKVLTKDLGISKRKAEEYVNSTGQRYNDLCVETPYEIEIERGKINLGEVKRNIRRIFMGKAMPKKLKGITRKMYALELPKKDIKRYIENNYYHLFGFFGKFDSDLEKIIDEVGNSKLKGQEAMEEVDDRFRRFNGEYDQINAKGFHYFPSNTIF